MALLKVTTRSNQFERRRRAGHEFTMQPQIIEVEGEAERLIRADDALIVTDVNGRDDAETSNLASEARAHMATRSDLERVTRERDAAFARLRENNLDADDLISTPQPRTEHDPKVDASAKGEPDEVAADFGTERPAQPPQATERDRDRGRAGFLSGKPKTR